MCGRVRVSYRGGGGGEGAGFPPRFLKNSDVIIKTIKVQWQVCGKEILGRYICPSDPPRRMFAIPKSSRQQKNPYVTLYAYVRTYVLYSM